jgi:hypothetical protein
MMGGFSHGFGGGEGGGFRMSGGHFGGHFRGRHVGRDDQFWGPWYACEYPYRYDLPRYNYCP